MLWKALRLVGRTPRSSRSPSDGPPEDLAEAFPIQLAAAVSDGRLSLQDLDALCAMTMGRGDVRHAASARTMIIAQARALVPGVVIDANCALQS